MAEKTESINTTRDIRPEFFVGTRETKIIQCGFRDKTGATPPYQYDYPDPDLSEIIQLDVGELLDLVPGRVPLGNIGLKMASMLKDLPLAIAIDRGDEDPDDWGPES